MRLYLDDDILDKTLVKLLVKAGHDVVRSTDIGLGGANDPVHFKFAVEEDRMLLSFNHDDFKELAQLIKAVGGHHPGVLIVRKDNDPRDMKPAGIVVALTKFIETGLPIIDQFVILNQYR